MNSSGDDTPLARFERFVSEILTVTKEDIQKAEAEAKGLVDAQEPAIEDEADE